SLCFSTLCLYSLLRRWWLLAGLSAAFASAAHPDAIVLSACCAWSAGAAVWKHREWRALIAPILAPAGLVVFFTYLRYHTGNFLAYVDATQARVWRDRLSPLHWFALLQTLWQHPLRDLNHFFPALGVLF